MLITQPVAAYLKQVNILQAKSTNYYLEILTKKYAYFFFGIIIFLLCDKICITLR